MNGKLAEILASNLAFIKVNNIEKAMGLNKTALIRMIARKEIPEKHKEAVTKWWERWVSELVVSATKKEGKSEEKNIGSIPPHPKREDFEDSFDFGNAKNEWKKRYNL